VKFSVRAVLLGVLLAMHCTLTLGAAEQAASVSDVRAALAKPLARLQDAHTLRGRFVQLKHLSGFSQAITSSGDFVFARGLGAIWRITEPIAAEFVLSAEGIRSTGDNVAAPDARLQPALKQVSDIFLALFALDLDLLAREFHLSLGTEAAGWRLRLEPRDKALDELARSVILSGTEQVERIELTDARGDRTEIQLKDVIGGTAPITEDERKLFSPAP
jgi:outer membrane lipoprotein-sorting protein